MTLRFWLVDVVAISYSVIMMRSCFIAVALALGIDGFGGAAEVFEIGKGNISELPKGKEADGIVGDFVLRNDKVEALISGNLPLRRPNMSAFYGDGNETPGCLYDLTLRGADNDQITIFSPCVQRGPVSYVRIVDKKNLPQGMQAGVETVTTAAKGGGLGKTHRYYTRNGLQGILIVSTFSNESSEEKKVSLTDGWTQMRSKGSVKGVQWADAIDPSHKCGYAYAWVTHSDSEYPKSKEVTLAPGQSLSVARFLAVGISPAEAVGHVIVFRDAFASGQASSPYGSVRIILRNEEGEPIKDGRVGITLADNEPVFSYPNNDGIIELNWPVGEQLLSIEDIGRETIERVITVSSDETASVLQEMSPLSSAEFSITDQAGNDTPCKVQFRARKGTPQLDLGPTDRAHGCKDQWHSETGRFSVPLPPGNYQIVVTRGPEYDAISKDILVGRGESVTIAGELIRSVRTPGWVSTDFHNHSTPSGDNTCGIEDRLINLAAEQIEFAPTTEHNRLYDWVPHINRLELTDFLKTIPGMELTGRGAHFNAFPLKPDPTRQDGGAPIWQKDPRLNAIVLRDYQGQEPDRWVHVNHPDMSENFVDRNHDGRPDGGYAFFGNLIDGLESQNYRGSNILNGAPFSVRKAKTGLGKSVNYHREFIWLQLLNQGLTVWGIGVADAHHVYGNGVGSWRTYIPSSTDKPSEIDWREISRNAKAGRMILTSGPYLEVETGAGIMAGGHDRVSGELKLKVKVQCANWLDIDRVQVLVNGTQDPRYNFTRADHADMFGDGTVKFDNEMELELSEDAHIIVVACGENSTLQLGFGSSEQASIHPCAYNNPIYVDVDGGGFQPNYDTLGYDLPVQKLSVQTVEKLLGL